MVRRRWHYSDTNVQRPQMLAAVASFRSDVIAASRMIVIGGPICLARTELFEACDRFVEAVTGERPHHALSHVAALHPERQTEELLRIVEYPSNVTDEDVRLVIATCGDDPAGAIRALLIGQEFLERQLDEAIAAASAGYARKGGGGTAAGV